MSESLSPENVLPLGGTTSAILDATNEPKQLTQIHDSFDSARRDHRDQTFTFESFLKSLSSRGLYLLCKDAADVWRGVDMPLSLFLAFVHFCVLRLGLATSVPLGTGTT
jgi:hypothetical protein